MKLAAALLRGESSGETFNFGPHTDSLVEVGAVVAAFASLWGTESLAKDDTGHQAHEAAFLALDSHQAELELAWQSRLTSHEALV